MEIIKMQMDEVYDTEKYPDLASRQLSQLKKKEAADQFYQTALETKRRLVMSSKAIDPTDRRFYLLSNSEMLTAIQQICDEIGFVLSSFLEYLVLPQSGLIGPMRRGYFEISPYNITNGFIQSPVISDKMMDYVLYCFLPYESIKDYDVIDVADVQDHSVESYDVTVHDEVVRVEPQMLFTNSDLEARIRVSKRCKDLLSSVSKSVLSNESCSVWRKFIKQMVHALQLFVPEGSDSKQYTEVAQQLQTQTWIVRGVEMGRDEKVRNALLWIITAGTDWLEKREVDVYDLEFGVKIILGEIGKDYLNRILKSAKHSNVMSSDSDPDLEQLRLQFLEDDLLIDVSVLRVAKQLLDSILSYPELLDWMDYRLNMFSQL